MELGNGRTMADGKSVDIIGPAAAGPDKYAEFVAYPTVLQTMPGMTGLTAPVTDTVCVDKIYAKSCVIVEFI
jgi:hypothetical protein